MNNHTDQLKLRILQAKSKIPHIVNYTAIYQEHFGVQDEKMLLKIRDVWNVRLTDEEITMNLEAIADQYSKINL